MTEPQQQDRPTAAERAVLEDDALRKRLVELDDALKRKKAEQKERTEG